MILNKKKIIALSLLLIILFLNYSLLGQTGENVILDSTDIDDLDTVTPPNVESIADTANDNSGQVNLNQSYSIKKILIIDDFEKFQSWRGKIAREFGYIKVRRIRLKNVPSDLQPAFENNQSQHQYVLGTKVTFEQRGKHTFEIFPPHPIDIEGITHQFSIWVRTQLSIKHKLFAVFKDIRGNTYRKRFLVSDSKNLLNNNSKIENAHLKTDENKKDTYNQWRKFTCDIEQVDELAELIYKNKINDSYPLQKSSFHTLNSFKREGVSFVRFEVQCDLEQTVGDYYLYLDQFEVTTAINSASYDGIENNW